jgi:hypothetical protein
LAATSLIGQSWHLEPTSSVCAVGGEEAGSGKRYIGWLLAVGIDLLWRWYRHESGVDTAADAPEGALVP